MQRHRQHQQEDPKVEVAGVVEFVLVRVVVPAPGQGSPHPLPERLDHLRAHGSAARTESCPPSVWFRLTWSPSLTHTRTHGPVLLLDLASWRPCLCSQRRNTGAVRTPFLSPPVLGKPRPPCTAIGWSVVHTNKKTWPYFISNLKQLIVALKSTPYIYKIYLPLKQP